jgi:hypothetical protein
MIIKDLGKDNYLLKIVDDTNFTNDSTLYEELDKVVYDIDQYTFTGKHRKKNEKSLGVSASLEDTHYIQKKFLNLISDKHIVSIFDNYILYRNHLQKTEPHHTNGQYHNDMPKEHVKTITTILYLNNEFDFNEQGETIFFIDGEYLSVAPKPGRLLIFDGSLLHATRKMYTKTRIVLVNKFMKTRSTQTLI